MTTIQQYVRIQSAALDMLAALENLIENAQPTDLDQDCSDEEAAAWRRAIHALCKAKGLPVPKNVERSP